MGLKITEGKRSLSFRAYKFLTRFIFKSERLEYSAARTFLVLDWNLIARAENCDVAHACLCLSRRGDLHEILGPG